MRYSGVLLKTEAPLGELVERIGELLGFKFSATKPHFAGRYLRTITLYDDVAWTQSSDDTTLRGYRIEVQVNGSGDRARMRNAREIYEKLRPLGMPLILLDRDIAVIDRWEPGECMRGPVRARVPRTPCTLATAERCWTFPLA